jgi:hypothetical protein
VRTHSSAKTAGRLFGLILLAWLAVPVIVLGWLSYGCRWLVTALYQLARVTAAGQRPGTA